MTENK